MWAGPAIALFVQTAIFWWRHRGVNDEEFMTHEEEATPFEPLEPTETPESRTEKREKELEVEAEKN